ncbi:hypothetical protein QQP08_012587 [Theobroma cacao]|nr:hypothetical protein QQP08_012587 [Theobroma cacao]
MSNIAVVLAKIRTAKNVEAWQPLIGVLLSLIWTGLRKAKEPSAAPWKMRSTIMQMEVFKSKLRGWSFRKISRAAYKFADKLTKPGVKRRDELIWAVNDDEGPQAQGLESI